MIEAVLKSLTEHVLKDAFKKNGRSTGYGACGHKGATLRVLVASRPRVTLHPDGSTRSWKLWVAVV
jgi:hypothetical protein